MNERIRELVRQAVIVVDDPFPGNPLNYELEKMYIPDCFAEKFAELIVRECIRYFNEDYERNFNKLWREDLTEGMKEHFGVEE